MLSVHGGAVEKSKQGRREGREGLVNPLCESALTFRGRCYGSGTEYGARLGALVSKDIYPPHMACQTLWCPADNHAQRCLNHGPLCGG